METQCRSPIMHNQYDVFGQSKSLEPSVKIARMIHEPVCVCRRLSRLTHPDQIGRETAAEFGYIGDDVAPEIGGGRIAMQEHDRLADANIDVTEFRVEDTHTPPRMRIGCADFQLFYQFHAVHE